MALRHGGMIEKTRFTVPWHGHEWEVDVFAGENAGLVIAEIELRCDELKQSMAQGRQISFEWFNAKPITMRFGFRRPPAPTRA
jgi:CYTH domain-containing protein